MCNKTTWNENYFWVNSVNDINDIYLKTAVHYAINSILYTTTLREKLKYMKIL